MGRRRHRRGRGLLTGRRLVALLIPLLIAAYAIWGPAIRGALGLEGDSTPPAKRDALRVVSWNLRNFPGKHQDLELVRSRLAALDADVIAVQEIKEPAALEALLPEWELVISERGGRGHQRVGVFYDPRRVELLGEAVEHDALSLGGRVRPALSTYVRGRAGGPDFHLVVVHLKAMRDGYDQRSEQWPRLAALVGELQTTGPGAPDRDVIVVGDFNTTGPPGGDPGDELRALGDVLNAVGLRRLATDGCSAYWDGPRRDAWQEPSLLDLVWISDLAEAAGGDARARAYGHCARHRCAAFRSTDAYPDLDFEKVSDHCPVVIDLALADDDP
ncbi:MAG: endonuclease/exonuclease/phosphatase family protein [Myxococcales bacterium]|nr:endonuclease/exonuclease/phosphatase family protein [Myxococcales bacterium]